MASSRAVRTSPAGRSSESSSASVATAVELASSPAAWPPMPSATTSSVRPAYPESSLSRRTMPTSDFAAYRRNWVIAAPYRCSCRVVRPTRTLAPTRRTVGPVIRVRSIHVPFVEPRSSTIHWPSDGKNRACRLEE